MLYRFICPDCKRTKTINVSADEISGTNVVCDCGKNMRRDWKTSVFVAESDRSNNIQDTSFINERMKIRPSGKTRSIY